MNRFATNMKRNVRFFVVGLAGYKHNFQDVSHTTTAGDPVVEAAKEKLIKDVTAISEKYIVDKDVNGMSIAITLNGKLLYKAGFGYKDAEKKIAADADMRGDVASISKLITTHLMMQLHERTNNNFDVFDSLYKYYLPHNRIISISLSAKTLNPPSWRNLRTPYPLVQPLYVSWLLCHRTGIPHYANFDLENADALNRRYQSSTEALDMFITRDLKSWPGVFQYTSYGLNFAGAIIEQLTKKNFREYATDELHRLNMRNSIFPRFTQDVVFNHATGYQDHNYLYSNFTDLTYKYPSGGLVSTVGDLVKFGDIYLAIFQGLLDDNTPGKSPLKKSTLDMMWSRHESRCQYNIIDNDRVGYEFQGLGWRLKNMKIMSRQEPFYVTSLYHTGNAAGFTSILGTNYITRDNGKDNVKYNYRKTTVPTLPKGVILCSCEELAQSSDISVDGFNGFTIAIIVNKKDDQKLMDLYWKISKLIVKTSLSTGDKILPFTY